jgi:hypothetical protein
MSRKPELSWIILLFFGLSLRGLALASGPTIGPGPQSQHGSEERSSVTVLVYNHARLPMETLQQVRDRTQLIFRKAGVEIEWADCPLKDEDPSLYPGCPAVIHKTQLFLRIFPQTAAKMNEGGEAFVAARIANIFWNRVDEQAQRLKVPTPRVMAHTIAHELGHLLLGSNSHSPTGIMTAHWDTQVLTRICQEGLYFNHQQSDFMRGELRKRESQESAKTDLLMAQR